MPTKKVFLAAYDAGHGFKVVDPADGSLLRQVRGSWWTDDIEGMYIEGNNLWVLDTDSSLVLADLDGVVRAKVDVGYYGRFDSSENAYWAMYVNGAHIYHLHRVDTSNPNPGAGYVQGAAQPADNQLFYIVKRDKLTLAIVSETKLDHATLADGPLNTNYIENGVRCWQADGFWVYLTGGVKVGFLVKVGFDGVPTGAEIDTAATAYNGYPSSYFWTSATRMVSPGTANYTGDYGGTHTISADPGFAVDFASAGSITGISAWGPVACAEYFETDSINLDRGARVSGDTLSRLVKLPNHAWVGGPHDSLTGAWAQFTYNYVDGTGFAESSPVWINYWDKPADINFAAYVECHQPYDVDRFFMIDERKGIWLVNFTTATVDYTTGFNFMQGYSSDATEIDGGMMVDIPYYTLSGTVTDGGTPVVGRKVFVYDQATGTYIGEAVTNGSGVYSMTVFTNSDKFVVCPSTDNTKNYKVNAHLTPA